MTSSPRDAYGASTTGLVWFDRSDRVRLTVKGPDRAKFLHNLATQEVKRLAVGQGREAFITSLQGKTLAFVTLHVTDDAILVRADPGADATLLPHLQKYGIFDDVTIDDESSTTFESHLAGSETRDLLDRLGLVPPEGEFSHALAEIAGHPVRLIVESPTGRPGLTILGARADAEALTGALGVNLGAPEVFETLRIEAGTPRFGCDLTPENLPQELGRDARAISFVKGCYLGQETVARIDALGHVNRLLRGLKVESEGLPSVGTPLLADGKAVGAITSVAFSPGWGRPIALGYVRVAHAGAGTALTLTVDGQVRTALVHELPMLPPGVA